MSRSFHPRLLRLRRDDRGVTLVEFGLIAPVLTFLIMGVVELGLLMGAQSVLDNAVFVASRTGKTGYAEKDKTQTATIQVAIQKAASGYLDPSKITVKAYAYSDYDSVGQPEPFTDLNSNGKRDASEPYTDVNGNGAYDTDQGAKGYGNTAQIVTYTALYNWTLFTPMLGRFVGTNGIVTLRSRIVVKNEPY